MTDYTKECVHGSEQLIDTTAGRRLGDIASYFSQYDTVYSNTNEDIGTYMSHFDMSDYHSALTVLSSGDHAFNLVHAGITDIDTFDSNKLTEYYALGLKRAMIMKYSYAEYLRVMQGLIKGTLSSEEELSILSDLLPYMDEEYRDYWRCIINYVVSKSAESTTKYGVISSLLKKHKATNIYFNAYVKSEEDYNKLKERLKNANISFSHRSAYELADDENKKYDVIMLSNILDYFWSTYKVRLNPRLLKTYEEYLFKILNDKGIAFLGYRDKYVKGETIFDGVIANSFVTESKLDGEELFKFSKVGAAEGLSSVLVRRKNNS